MNTRITTSNDIENKIQELQNIMKLSTKAAVMRIAIGLSLRLKEDPREKFQNDINDNSGANYQRITITGDFDDIYKSLITNHFGQPLDDNQKYIELIKAHISRGVNILYEEYQLKGSSEKIIDTLFELI